MTEPLPQPKSVASLIDQVINEKQIADPVAITAAVIDLIPADGYAAALAEVLPAYVRDRFGLMAMELRADAALDETEEQREVHRHRSANSWRVAGIRGDSASHPEWWSRTMMLSVRVKGGWVFLKDCKPVDLAWMATARYEMAARTQATGDRYARLAEACLEHGGCAIGDLPVEIFQEIWRSHSERPGGQT